MTSLAMPVMIIKTMERNSTNTNIKKRIMITAMIKLNLSQKKMMIITAMNITTMIIIMIIPMMIPAMDTIIKKVMCIYLKKNKK